MSLWVPFNFKQKEKRHEKQKTYSSRPSTGRGFRIQWAAVLLIKGGKRMILKKEENFENKPDDSHYGYGRFARVFQRRGLPMPGGGKIFPFRFISDLRHICDDRGEWSTSSDGGYIQPPAESDFPVLLQAILDPYGESAENLLRLLGNQLSRENFNSQILVFFPWELDVMEESLKARGPSRDQVGFGEYVLGRQSRAAIGFLQACTLVDLQNLAQRLSWLQPIADCLKPISCKQKVAFFPDSTFPLPRRYEFEESPVSVGKKEEIR